MGEHQGFAVVVAADEAGGIGQRGKLPWRLSSEMAYFKRITSEAPHGLQNAVLMGRKTYESIPSKFRPLTGRLNVVLTRAEQSSFEGALVASSLDDALTHLDARSDLARTFVIGGGELYREALVHPRCALVYLTRVHARFDCDTHLPALDASFERVSQHGPHEEGELSYTFELYQRTV
jgi:dihydrofolate reductase